MKSVASARSLGTTTTGRPRGKKFAAIFVLVLFRVIIYQFTKPSLMPYTNPSDAVSPNTNSSKGDEKQPHLPPDGKLRVLLTSGCSGSSFTLSMTKNLLRRHGFAVNSDRQELYNKAKNPMFDKAKKLAGKGADDNKIIIDAIVLLNQERFDQGQITLTKCFHPMLVGRVGGHLLSGAMYRENVLDWLVCHVRDCFMGGKGYPVFAVNGSRSHLCFARRKVKGEDEKTKAYIDPKKIVGTMRHREKVLAVSRKEYSPYHTYEELTDFEYTMDNGVWEASLGAWSSLLGAYIGNSTSVDARIVKDVLLPMRNSRTISNHEETIHNYKEIFKILRGAGMGGYIRSNHSTP